MEQATTTELFTGRAASYAKSRPRYPSELLDYLKTEIGFNPEWTVADVGSGTGLSSLPFLEAGCVVFGVEPNQDMREEAERNLDGFRRYWIVNGTAEASDLAADSIDFYVAGQSFHWFNAPAARLEALRILREPRRAMLLWFERDFDASPFAREYEETQARLIPGYKSQAERHAEDASVKAFFGAGSFAQRDFPQASELDFEGLWDRFLSSSYAPAADDPANGRLRAEFQALFNKYEQGGKVSLKYLMRVYLGTVG